MNKTQYAEMLKDISETHKNGGDVSACIAKYNERYKYVYVYNDNIFKILFGNPENESITVDFLNAVLKLDGGDCIERVSFVNPALPEAIGKSITSDVVALDQRQERIVLEVQHVEHESYNSRLVLYAAKHTIASRVKGDDYRLRNLNLISLQMFDGFPESRNYRHCIRLKNQDNEVFYEKETITLVEIPKFIKRKYEKDSSRLALWLRVFDGLNRECPVDVPKGSQYALLQEKAKLCIFTKDFLVSEAMKMSDHNYELYVEKLNARAEGLADGRNEGRAEGRVEGRAEGRVEGRVEGRNDERTAVALDMLADNEPIEKIVKYSHLPESKILELRDSRATYSSK
jgi:predicted transposase/invertase (TIGR01784 family)